MDNPITAGHLPARLRTRPGQCAHSGLVTVTFARQSAHLARGRRLSQFPVAVHVGCATAEWIK